MSILVYDKKDIELVKDNIVTENIQRVPFLIVNDNNVLCNLDPDNKVIPHLSRKLNMPVKYITKDEFKENNSRGSDRTVLDVTGGCPEKRSEGPMKFYLPNKPYFEFSNFYGTMETTILDVKFKGD